MLGCDCLFRKRFAAYTGQYENGSGAGAKARLDVADAIADHEAARQIESVFTSRIEQELRLWFPAIAIVLRMMGTNIVPFESYALFLEVLIQMGMDGFNRFAREIAAADSRLVGDDKELIASVLQSLESGYSAGNEHNVVDFAYVIRAFFCDGAVPVKKDCAAAVFVAHGANSSGMLSRRKRELIFRSNFAACPKLNTRSATGLRALTEVRSGIILAE
jgi:hypothetical protein